MKQRNNLHSIVLVCAMMAVMTPRLFAENTKGPANADCLACHAGTGAAGSVDAKKFENSIHGTQACTDCHYDIKELPHDGLKPASDPNSPIYWQNVPATCGQCHPDITKTFNRSTHGKAVAAGNRNAPVCTDCHSEHSIDAVKKSSSKVFTSHIAETCGQCHAAERITTKYQLPGFVVNTYMESYHGLALQRGSVTAANCASCHNSHDILPSQDPDSSVNSRNLQRTCGKCHAGIGEKIASGRIHSGGRPSPEEQATNVVKNFYFFLFFLIFGLMIIHNFLDLLTKLRAHYRRASAAGTGIRMDRNERIQHIILITTFFLLAYTGFALKYPQAWWATPFLGTWDWRGLCHRAAAVIFIGLAGYHLWFLLFTAKGRRHLEHLLPRRKDAVQFLQTFDYYLGKRKDKPVPGFYGYVEKMEYWALVWGSVIMVITGGIMMQKELFLKFFPKWLFDAVTAVHFYEAILACVAIILWHWYFVIFDPDVYPMKWTWLNGRGDENDGKRVSWRR